MEHIIADEVSPPWDFAVNKENLSAKNKQVSLSILNYSSS